MFFLLLFFKIKTTQLIFTQDCNNLFPQLQSRAEISSKSVEFMTLCKPMLNVKDFSFLFEDFFVEQDCSTTFYQTISKV